MKTMVTVFALCAATVGALVLSAGVSRAQLLIIGNDEKVRFDPATGKTVNQAPGNTPCRSSTSTTRSSRGSLPTCR